MTNERTIVFVPQRNSKINYHPAAQFGELQFLFDDKDYNHASQLYVDKVKAHMLQQFAPGDYLLLAGDPILISICFNVMSQLTGGEDVRCLKWDRANSTYYPISLSNLNIETESQA